ncbi:MAG: hypothetical protein AAB300_04835 [Nitrospirota bacterium]
MPIDFITLHTYSKSLMHGLIKNILGLFPVFSKNTNPYIRKVLKQGKSVAIQEIIEKLPSLANAMIQGSDAIYSKLLYPQFQDYEMRYGCAIVAQIDEKKKLEIVRAGTAFMLYTFYSRVNNDLGLVSVPLTYALHFEIYKEEPKAGSFVDYLTYQNPHFEDPKMAPSFKFGNEIAQILATMDMAFLFMASQQAVLISEITKNIITGFGLAKEDRG